MLYRLFTNDEEVGTLLDGQNFWIMPSLLDLAVLQWNHICWVLVRGT
jgi:hypothetical protein